MSERDAIDVPTAGTFSREVTRPRAVSKPGDKPNRWTIPLVQCMDCGALYGVDESIVDRDVGRPVGDGDRVVLVWLPETCPKCRNLRVCR